MFLREEMREKKKRRAQTQTQTLIDGGQAQGCIWVATNYISGHMWALVGVSSQNKHKQHSHLTKILPPDQRTPTQLEIKSEEEKHHHNKLFYYPPHPSNKLGAFHQIELDLLVLDIDTAGLCMQHLNVEEGEGEMVNQSEIGVP